MAIADKIQRIINEKNSLITSLKTKGFDIPDNAKLGDLTDIVENTDIGGGGDTPSPAGKKAVNFYDYDGTLLHSYTKDEVLALSELPDLPDRTSEGLTCQGWNYVLNGYVDDDGTAVSGIIDDLSANNENFAIDVGATYIPTDGATHINITFADKYRNVMPLTFAGDVTIDWGDGVTESANHTSATTITHEYAIAQSYPVKYTIKLTVNNGTLTLGGGSSSYNICGSSSDSIRVYSSRIDSVFIGNSVTSIGAYAFQHCYSLASIMIPNSVTSIDTYAFQYCSSLASVTIPNGVTSIGDSAFYRCYSLASISIPNSVISIGIQAFFNCNSLASISIPGSGITSIGDGAFYQCYALASISIPNSVISIGNSAFQACYSLASITIPNSVKSISERVFYNCYSLASITISDGVTSIGNYAFGYCYSLVSISIPNSVTSIGNYAFRACYSLTSVTIPNSIESIGNLVFGGCSSLISVTIPNSVTNIGPSAFYGCNALVSVTIPDGVTSIDTQAFFQCYSLASVKIPSGVTSINAKTFYQCYGIIKYDFSTHTSIPTLDNTNAFTDIASDAKIVVPDDLYDTWITETNWATYADYIVKASEYDEPQYIPPHTIITYTDGNTTEIEAGDDGVLTQTLVRDAGDYTTIQSVEIGGDVTSIGDFAFYTCSSLTSVTIPEGVTSIGNYAFSGCSGLTSVTILEGVTSIMDDAFARCPNLTSVTIPESVTEILGEVFLGCSSLTSVRIPKGVTEIGWVAFADCSSLNDITFDKTMEEVSSMTNYPWGISSGKVIKCTDGDITVS